MEKKENETETKKLTTETE